MKNCKELNEYQKHTIIIALNCYIKNVYGDQEYYNETDIEDVEYLDQIINILETRKIWIEKE